MAFSSEQSVLRAAFYEHLLREMYEGVLCTDMGSRTFDVWYGLRTTREHTENTRP